MNYVQTPSASRSDKNWSAGSSKAGSMSSGWSSLLGGELWELEAALDELLGLLSQDFAVWLDNGLDDVDGVSSGTVSTSHLLVHVGDGTAESGGSVLLVHVDYISSCSILKYDSVVLNGAGFLLEDLRNRNDLSLAFSNLVLSLHFIPEVGSGEDDVLSEDSDSVTGWLWVALARKLSSDNPILLNLQSKQKLSYLPIKARHEKHKPVICFFVPSIFCRREGAIDLRFSAWRELRHL